MFSIMLWSAKQELRVVNLAGTKGADWSEFQYLPEHRACPPRFDSAEAGWAFIRKHYPFLAP